MTPSRASGRDVWLALAVVCASNAALLWFFHNRYWYPTDDGFYAHIAERLLSGEVLNRDVQDIHPGYIHAVHAWAFRLFGVDLVSLRYPMVAAAFVQSIVTFVLLRRRGLLMAVIGSFAANALGIVQFMSPNANWYCLALAVSLAWWLMSVADGPMRLVGAGVILGTLTMFRHLTGVWVAMGVIAFVLIERSGDAGGRQLTLVRLQIAIMLAALVGYLYWSPETEPGGLIFMGVWPIAVLGWMLVKTRTRNRDVTSSVGQLLAGTLIPVVPLVVYHVFHGSLGVLIRDLVVVAGGESELGFYGQGWYGVLPLAGLYQATSSPDVTRVVNGLYWVVLPGISALNGALLLRAVRNGVEVRMLALPLIAVFHAMVALLFEGPLYLYYSVGLSLISALWLLSAGPPAIRTIAVATTAALSAIAVTFHAGQTRERTPNQILAGERATTFATQVDCGIPRCSLKVSAPDAEIYRSLTRIITTETAPDDFMLAIPNDAELYFLAQRRNPTRFYNAAQGTTTEAQRRDVFQVLQQKPPRVVVFRPADKYNNAATADIMTSIRTKYSALGQLHGTEIYRRRN
jgi:hypothetical protein